MTLPVHGALNGTNMLQYAEYGEFNAKIDHVISRNNDVQRWQISQIFHAKTSILLKVRNARLTVAGDIDAQAGDNITGRFRFASVPAPIVLDGYDSQFVGYYAGTGAYGTVLGDLSVKPANQFGFREQIDRLRTYISDRLIYVLGERIGAIAMALINGDQSRIAQQDRASMALAGLAHVLSVSGLHLTLVAGTFYGAVRFGLAIVGERFYLPSKAIAAWAGIVISVLYMLISGLQVPAIRSTLMLILIFSAIIAGRPAISMRNVAIAALALAIIDPTSVFRPSYQMSFAAVVALVAVFEVVAGQTKREVSKTRFGKYGRFVFDLSLTILAAGFATLTFTAFHFQQTAPLGLIGNLLIGPVVSFVMMPSALMAMLLFPLGADGPFLWVMGKSIEVMLFVSEQIVSLSHGFDPSPVLHISALIVCMLALAWLAFFQGRIRYAGALVGLVVVALFCIEAKPDVIVADGTQALAVRQNGEFGLLAGRGNTFATNVWAERYMEPIHNKLPVSGCDSSACFAPGDGGFLVSYVKEIDAFYEDCQVANLVVTRSAAPAYCSSLTQVVDERDLKLRGTHFMFWDEAEAVFKIKPAMADYKRPWRVKHANMEYELGELSISGIDQLSGPEL